MTKTAAAADTALESGPVSRQFNAPDRHRSEKIRIEQHSASGLLWFIGWLFTIGYLHLPFGKALLGLVVWPYYLGTALAGAAH